MPKWTKEIRKRWQPYVDSQIRRQTHAGVEQERAVEHALDLRDEHIKNKDAPPKFGRKKGT